MGLPRGSLTWLVVGHGALSPVPPSWSGDQSVSWAQALRAGGGADGTAAGTGDLPDEGQGWQAKVTTVVWGPQSEQAPPQHSTPH